MSEACRTEMTQARANQSHFVYDASGYTVLLRLHSNFDVIEFSNVLA